MSAAALAAGLAAGLAVLVWTSATSGVLAARVRPQAPTRPAANGTAALLAAVRSAAPGVRRAADAARIEAVAAAELLAACLAVGCPPPAAAEAVAAARPGPVGDRLAEASALIRLGADPVRVWSDLAGDPALAGVGKALARAAGSGTPAAAVLAEEARRLRRARGLAADAAVARVGVLAAAPLGLCFLPAFLCLGVLPVVLGLGGSVLHD